MEAPALAYTVREFCHQARISERFYFKMQSLGEGPRVVRLGRRVVIPQEAAKRWLDDRLGAGKVA